MPNTCKFPATAAILRILNKHDEYAVLEVEKYREIEQSQLILSAGTASLAHQKENWDSNLFGVSVGKVEYVAGENKKDITQVVKNLLKENAYSYTLFRIPTEYSVWLEVLKNVGAIIVDEAVELVMKDLSRNFNSTEFTVQNFTEKYTNEVQECARSFKYGRFFTDPDFLVGREAYRQWVNNAINGKTNDSVAVAIDKDGKLAGFIAYKEKLLGTSKCLYVSLIAKHPDCYKKGVATALLGYLRECAIASNSTAMLLGTQKNNVPALGAYHKLGFTDYFNETVLRLYKP